MVDIFECPTLLILSTLVSKFEVSAQDKGYVFLHFLLKNKGIFFFLCIFQPKKAYINIKLYI